MAQKIGKGLRKAVKEYYQWHGDKTANPVKIIRNKKVLEAVVVRVKDADGDEITTLMDFMGWKDGHYDVTEFDYADRRSEALLIADFEQSE